ncbi:MAG: hypothetical protein H0U98_13875 [Alphaproteobacteria bacterium]|nr:hypothetical protein [Alphaproteobacteria bacterium]
MTKAPALVISLLLTAPGLTPAWAQQPGTAYSQVPSGEGDALAITCRPPQVMPNSRLPGPEVCKTNAQWARYRKDGMEVAADGVHDVPSEKWRSINPQACRPGTMGSGGTISAIFTTFTMICE